MPPASPRGVGRTVRRCAHGPWSRAQGRAPAAGTVVVAAPQAGLDSAAPGDRGSVAAPNTTDVSKMDGRRVASHAPQPRSPFRYVRRHSEEELSQRAEPGGGRAGGSGSSMHPDSLALQCRRPGPRSAQALVQVGRGEEGVGSQAHGQEALDQGGAKPTSPGGLLGAPLGGGVHRARG